MLDDKIKVIGTYRGTLIHEDGSVEVSTKHNLVVSSGVDFIFDAVFKSSATAKMTYIAVGTGTTAVLASQTALVAELLRKSVVYAHTAGTTVCSVTATFAKGEATGAITELGILSASTSGVLFDRVVIPVVNKGANDIYTVEFDITLTASV